MMAFDELLPSVCDATRKCVERKYHNHIFPFLSDVAMQTARAAFDSVFLRSDITSPRIGSLTQLECWQSLWPNILPSSPFLYFVKLKLVFYFYLYSSFPEKMDIKIFPIHIVLLPCWCGQSVTKARLCPEVRS